VSSYRLSPLPPLFLLSALPRKMRAAAELKFSFFPLSLDKICWRFLPVLASKLRLFNSVVLLKRGTSQVDYPLIPPSSVCCFLFYRSRCPTSLAGPVPLKSLLDFGTEVTSCIDPSPQITTLFLCASLSFSGDSPSPSPRSLIALDYAKWLLLPLPNISSFKVLPPVDLILLIRSFFTILFFVTPSAARNSTSSS